MSNQLIEDLLEPFGHGRGFEETLTVAQPLAGAAAVPLPLDSRWTTRLLDLNVTLVTDANVGNRLVTVEYQDGNGVSWCVNGAALLIPTGTTQTYHFQHGRTVTDHAAGTDVWIPLMDRLLHGGYVAKIVLAGVKAGDQLSAISLRWEKFETGPKGAAQGRVLHGRRHGAQPPRIAT